MTISPIECADVSCRGPLTVSCRGLVGEFMERVEEQKGGQVKENGDG
jgi:hypothetical protein